MMDETRPDLTAALAPEEFLAWYWLKSELIEACRNLGIAGTGSKPELTERIAMVLDGRAVDKRSNPRKSAPMPKEFSLDTKIAPGWRCSSELRRFLVSECGKSFRFNGPVRALIFLGDGTSLRKLIDVFDQTQTCIKGESAIIPQNQFNKFLREFHLAHPNASRLEALSAWSQTRTVRGALPPLAQLRS